MNKHTMSATAALVLMAASASVAADEAPMSGPSYAPSSAPPPANVRMIAGTERDAELFETGARAAITSPNSIVNQVREDTENFGPAGLVSGVVRGSLKAGGKAFMGGARMLIGVVDIVTMPFGRID